MSNKQTFKVLNMNCNHCVNNISKTLKNMKGIDDVTFNLEEKKIEVTGSVASDIIISSLDEAGYEAVKPK